LTPGGRGLHPDRRRGVAAAFGVLLTIVAALLCVFSLKLDPNVIALVPSRGQSAALGRYLRGFGGGGFGVLLVEGDDPAANEAAAALLADALGKRASVDAAVARIAAPTTFDPMLVFRQADAAGRAELARALEPVVMRERLDETRRLLLAPGSGVAADAVARDPLRLGALAIEARTRAGGVRARSDGWFATEDGLAFLVLAKPKGQALRGEDAHAFMDDARSAVREVTAAHPGVKVSITGPHATAEATEKMIRGDLEWSGALSLGLACAAFGLVTRRVRALAAIVPALLVGGLWTTALAALWPGGVSAIAVAFGSVVLGVGFDTGVHVYAAMLDARRAGLEPREAATTVRKKMARPLLVAAVTAAAAFASLTLSEIDALKQLGALCAGGEILTAIAILGLTPEIAARLERGPPPPRALDRLGSVLAIPTRTKKRAAIAIVIAIGASLAWAPLGGPLVGAAIVAIRPKGLTPLQVEERIFERFGSKRSAFVALVEDADLDAAMAEADRVAADLEKNPDVETVDALAATYPSRATQEERLRERDALDLPARAADLEKALGEVGFAPARFAAAIDHMRNAPHDTLAVPKEPDGPTRILLARYVGFDEGRHLVAVHVVTPDGDPARIARVDADLAAKHPGVSLTGYGRLELTLRETLARDLPRVGLASAVLVVFLLAISLRSLRDVAIAAGVIVVSVSAVLSLATALGVPLHAYSALVLPVLLGITVDEATFLLHGSRATDSGGDPIEEGLVREAPPITTTALTTAAGFGALAPCQFDGLAHLGAIGAFGSIVGLIAAVIVVPAGLRLTLRRTKRP
jgi:predicted RND superfamily exporter protein